MDRSCCACGKDKSILQFAKLRGERGSGGYDDFCKDCRAESDAREARERTAAEQILHNAPKSGLGSVVKKNKFFFTVLELNPAYATDKDGPATNNPSNRSGSSCSSSGSSGSGSRSGSSGGARVGRKRKQRDSGAAVRSPSSGTGTDEDPELSQASVFTSPNRPAKLGKGSRRGRHRPSTAAAAVGAGDGGSDEEEIWHDTAGEAEMPSPRSSGVWNMAQSGADDSLRF